MNITNASNVGISDAKLDKTNLPSQLDVDDFYLIRLDRSKVLVFHEKINYISYEDSFGINTKRAVLAFTTKVFSLKFISVQTNPTGHLT